ncbi:glutathione peroxidase [Paenibacillus sacheonensis]|uniref:Glutathione peroxidase n=1 Tax=Paenibacillus sacheonensis TaxID=742054 RepID=A0A7X4YSC9_9BACL|nr:glutathione peroxidase [Paenibacillus sacheonensis]MBM7566678.1 glutathione peroxidase [Paenibacillus sacheonensis]NBC70659.1 redoxin domain-containing protein [Paenibacillus sacheonensis]
MTTLYDLQATTIQGKEQSLADYKGEVLLIVNTASKCGFTPQYEELQKLHEQFGDQGLRILGFPSNQFGEQEPGANSDVQSFCQLNYGVTFPLFAKTDVRGEDAHPVFRHLTERAPFLGFNTDEPSGKMLHSFLSEKLPEWLGDDSIKWNFTKFLVNRRGEVAGRYESTVEPLSMTADIEALLSDAK